MLKGMKVLILAVVLEFSANQPEKIKSLHWNRNIKMIIHRKERIFYEQLQGSLWKYQEIFKDESFDLIIWL